MTMSAFVEALEQGHVAGAQVFAQISIYFCFRFSAAGIEIFRNFERPADAYGGASELAEEIFIIYAHRDDVDRGAQPGRCHLGNPEDSLFDRHHAPLCAMSPFTEHAERDSVANTVKKKIKNLKVPGYLFQTDRKSTRLNSSHQI